jgi:hypothetical protein
MAGEKGREEASMVGEGRFTRRQAFSAAGAAAAGALVATAGPARAEGMPEIVGSWFATVTATDPPLGSFASMLSFHADGTLTESRRLFLADSPLGPLLETGGHGAWGRTGVGSYDAFFRFLLQQAPPSAGAPVGTDDVTLQLEIRSRTGVMTGNFSSTIKGTDGQAIFTASGTVVGERIEVK